jgi:hypothetical protein
VKLEKVWAMFLIQCENSAVQVKKCASDFVKLKIHDISLFIYIKGYLAWDMRGEVRLQVVSNWCLYNTDSAFTARDALNL